LIIIINDPKAMRNGLMETMFSPQSEKCAVERATTDYPLCPLCGSKAVSNFRSAPDRFHLRREMYHLDRCSTCQCVWLASPPSPEEMGHHYGKTYHKAISTSGEANAARWAKQCRKLAELKNGGMLLDIGCSSGAFLSTLTGQSWSLYGIEIDPEQASRAEAKTGAKVFAGDLLEASFEAGSFDAITMFHVLEHFDRPRERMARIFNWLKPGGILYLGLPNIDSWEAQIFRSYWFGLEMPRHFYLYSPRSLRQLLLSAGLHEVWLQTPGSYATQSIRYLVDAAVQRLGMSRVPLAEMGTPGLAGMILRKAFRLFIGFPFMKLSEFAEKGANLEAVYSKE
jgi:SAM-dependent methyltransferase